LPRQYLLSQNFPNPFNPSTTISAEIPTPSYVAISIYNSLGQQVRVLHAGMLQEGRQWFRWDGRDNSLNVVPSGAYYCRMIVSGGKALVTRMLLIR
jgi:flagellar hook assembly protein FlgD